MHPHWLPYPGWCLEYMCSSPPRLTPQTSQSSPETRSQALVLLGGQKRPCVLFPAVNSEPPWHAVGAPQTLTAHRRGS